MEMAYEFFEAAFPWLAMGFVLAVALANMPNKDND